MPSPFPGMDPWVENETIFPDFHDRFLNYLNESINAGLPPGYFAATTMIVYEEEGQRRKPDLSVFADDGPAFSGGAVTAVLSEATLAGLLELDVMESVEERYLEIRSGEDERLVTAIELLSHANKRDGAEGRAAYRRKQAEFREARVNLVEFDFLRAGLPTTMAPKVSLRRRAGYAYDYHIAVTMFGRYEAFHGAALRLSDSLPAIGIPLDPGVPAVVVALQPLFDRTYDTGRYGQRLKYDKPTTPPLSPEQQAWADELLHTKGVL